MMNEAIVEKVKALIAAPSCYAGLKKIAEEYIAALGSDREKEAGRRKAGGFFRLSFRPFCQQRIRIVFQGIM